jgi:predicted RNA-binding protein with PIN domain
VAGAGSIDRALRPACRLAVAVALEGEVADPPVPAPPALRPVLGFSRLSAAAYAVIGRVIDEDGTFRARVAERADEAEVGRAGWLWLQRPVDWADDPVFHGGVVGTAAVPDASAGGRGSDERDRTAKLRKQVADLQAERKRLAGEVGEARRSLAEAEAARAALEGDLARLREERNAAVRTTKALEADLAEARRERRVARAATQQAEAELAALRAGAPQGPVGDADVGGAGGAGGRVAGRGAGRAAGSDRSASVPTGGPAPTGAPAPTAQVDGLGGRGPGAGSGSAVSDRAVPLDEVAAQVSAAAGAAAELARALASVAGLVQPSASVPDASAVDGVDGVEGGPGVGVGSGPVRSAGPGDRGAGRGHRRSAPRRRTSARRPAALPAGIFDGTPEAVRHLVTSPDNLLVVDGYNLARAAWTGLAPEEERRRTVALLEEVQARSNGTVVVAFDGDGSVVAPLASKHVRVRFSATGQTADDLIGELVAAVPATQPVVVVSSDREVMADAERLGATSVGSEHLLRACGR